MAFRDVTNDRRSVSLQVPDRPPTPALPPVGVAGRRPKRQLRAGQVYSTGHSGVYLMAPVGPSGYSWQRIHGGALPARVSRGCSFEGIMMDTFSGEFLESGGAGPFRGLREEVMQ